MGKLIKLNIVAPGREVLTEEVVSLATTESDGKIEILANYAPTIIATIPTITTYTTIDGPIFLPFTVHGVLMAGILKWLPFPSSTDHILSELSTMTHLS